VSPPAGLNRTARTGEHRDVRHERRAVGVGGGEIGGGSLPDPGASQQPLEIEEGCLRCVAPGEGLRSEENRTRALFGVNRSGRCTAFPSESV